MSLKDRIIRKEITEEFMSHACGVSADEAADRLEKEVRRFEQTYNVVADVEKPNSKIHGRVWTIQVVPARDAHRDEIMRGLQSIQHYMANPPEDDE